MEFAWIWDTKIFWRRVPTPSGSVQPSCTFCTVHSQTVWIYPGCYISFYHHLPIRASKEHIKLFFKLPKWHFTCPKQEKSYFLYWKSCVHNTLFACLIRATVLGHLKCLLESDFYLPQAIGQLSAYVAPWVYLSPIFSKSCSDISILQLH